MKQVTKKAFDYGVFLLAAAGILLLLPGRLAAQPPQNFFPTFNPPPCDFSDAFYTANGFSVTNLNTSGAARFGNFRQTGPPAMTPNQANWVNDPSCSTNDPNRRDVRILATTGAYKDDDGTPTQFFSLIAFGLNENFFTGGANATPNARGFTTEEIVANFEAYGALSQRVNGVLAPTPCGTMADPTLAASPCFPVTSVATPALRQDWRISSNRNAIDGSSGGPFGYFCDDLTGSWIITYSWFTQFSVGGVSNTGARINPTSTCQNLLAIAGRQNGFNKDGTPILVTGDEQNFLEGDGVSSAFGLGPGSQPPPTAPCLAEGKEDVGGADGGAVWLICPTLVDPRNGAIARDAFLDVVRTSNGNGNAVDPRFGANFACLQTTGQFANSTGFCNPNPSPAVP
ncbi:MAG TPA: hypothetical protein VKB88_12400 [Bryobacteraceae bacterium]|nr:hypothetical protein [Bryobacteraceae bacterium]